MLNNSNMTDTDQIILMANNLSSFVISVTLSLFALSSSLFSLCFLHTYLKKLHAIIKNILTILCGYNLMCCTVTCIILIYFRMTSQQTITLCGLIQLTTITPSMITFDTICIISVVRYHMTWKTNQLELFKKHRILLSVAAVYFAEHILGLVYFIIAQMDFSVIQPSTACVGKDIMKKVPAMAYFLLLKLVIICSVGILYDIRLMKLLKKRQMQRVGPGEIQIIPWKSANASDTSVKVPIRATTAALSCIFFALARVTYVNVFFTSPIHWTQTLKTCMTTIGVLMPVLLFLTIRAHKKKKTLIVPNYPMYHNDQYLNEEQSENEQRDNDIFNIDPNIFTLEHFRGDHALIHVKLAPPSRTFSNCQ